jgi:transcriptional regulator with XRE-family HTH domain
MHFVVRVFYVLRRDRASCFYEYHGMSKHPQSVFGKRLRAARERLAIPQDKLGVAIGIDEGSCSARISRYETGAHAPPFEIAQKLAAVLNVPVSYFYCPQDAMADLLLDLSNLIDSEIQLLRQYAIEIIRKRNGKIKST